jgi:hypothetical protein
MDKNEIIFVTAYKDIKRSGWNRFSRTNKEYIDWFYNLAYNITYKLVVYVEDDILKMITEKNMFGDHIIFKNFNSVDTFLNKYLEKENDVISSDIYKSRIHPSRREFPEHCYGEYNLITHSKVNFVKNCKDCFPSYQYYAWIDFGSLNSHIGHIPTNLDLSGLQEKIYCHAFLPLPEKRLDEIEMLSTGDVYILGSGFIAHHSLVEKFESLWEQKIVEWQNKFISDDDQSLAIQLYYDNPHLFGAIHYDLWFGLYPYFFKEKEKELLKKISYGHEKYVATELCEIMGRNKSNKGHANLGMSWHNYTPFYYANFKNMRMERLRVFELGLGKTNTIIPSNDGGWDTVGVVGGSLYGWREFFANSTIYGADYDTDKLVNSRKIQSYYCNQIIPQEIHDLWKQPDMDEPFHIIIQNVLGRFGAIVTFFENSIHRLVAKNGFYVVEDVLHEELHLFSDIISRKWQVEYPKLSFQLYVLHSKINRKNNNLLVVSS